MTSRCGVIEGGFDGCETGSRKDKRAHKREGLGVTRLDRVALACCASKPAGAVSTQGRSSLTWRAVSIAGFGQKQTMEMQLSSVKWPNV